MKNKKRLLALLLGGVLTVSATGSVWANNNIDWPININVSAWGWTALNHNKEKQDDSSIYLYLTYLQSNDSIQVRAEAIGSGRVNCTYVPGLKNVDHVRCMEGIRYAIQNTVWEDGYRYGDLSFNSFNAVNLEYVEGEWSVDSTGSYPIARDY